MPENGESTYEYVQRGRELLEDGSYSQAARALELAREQEPRKGSILELLGRAYFGQRRFDRAADSFSDAVEVDPTNDYAHYCLGLCCIKLSRSGEAARHFKMAWCMRPLEIYREKAFRYGARGAAAGGGAAQP